LQGKESQRFQKGSWLLAPPIIFIHPWHGSFCQSSKKMARAHFYRKLAYINCFQLCQIFNENRSVRNTKICISDTPQMINAGIPHR
jgi:hypothetical protein